MSLTGNIEVVNTAVNPISNAVNSDMVIYTDSNSQRILLSCGSNQNSTLTVTRSNVTVLGDIAFTGSLLQNGTAFSSGTTGLSNSSSNIIVNASSNLVMSTGQILLNAPTDTASYPSLTFVGDQTTGLFQPSTGQVAVTTSGTQVMSMSNTGVTVSSNLRVMGQTFIDSDINLTEATITSAGKILMNSNDSSNAPAYSWNGDSSTGVYRARANVVGIAAGGSNMLVVSPSNVSVAGPLLMTDRFIRSSANNIAWRATTTGNPSFPTGANILYNTIVYNYAPSGVTLPYSTSTSRATIVIPGFYALFASAYTEVASGGNMYISIRMSTNGGSTWTVIASNGLAGSGQSIRNPTSIIMELPANCLIDVLTSNAPAVLDQNDYFTGTLLFATA